jgi:hypothetical protein
MHAVYRLVIILLTFSVSSISHAQGRLVLSASQFNFPAQAIGTASQPLVASASNPDTVPHIFFTHLGAVCAKSSAPCLVAPGDTDFVVSSDCTNEAPIPAGATCHISVVFIPSGLGSRNATLNVALLPTAIGLLDAGSRDIALEGTGITEVAAVPAMRPPATMLLIALVALSAILILLRIHPSQSTSDFTRGA